MEIVHRLYSLFPMVILMICFSKTDEYNLSWKVENKVLQYGDDLSLFCPVDNCCLESAGWGKWTSKDELTTIFIDVKDDLDSNDTSKYAGGTYLNGFSLLIRNFSKEDLNIAYSSTYGFLVSQKKILLWTDAFRLAKPEIDHMKEIKPVIIGLPLSLSLLAVACVVVVVICVFLKKKSKSEMESKDSVHKSTDDSLSTETSTKLLLKTESNPMDIDRSDPVPRSALPCTGSYPMFDKKHLGDSTGNTSAVSDESYMTCRTPSTFSFRPQIIEEE